MTDTPPVATTDAPDATSPDELAAAENSFATIFEAFSRQRAVAENTDTPDASPKNELHLSPEGFEALALENARFVRLTGPRVQSAERPAEVLDNQQVDQMVVHPFGWAHDRQRLAHRSAGTPVEGGTGYDPAKVAAELQSMMRGTRQAPHCLVSRRGDIYCLLPWSRASVLSAPRGSTTDIPSRSISVAVEMRYSARVAAYDARRADIPIAMAEPLTGPQRTALAFLARKLMTWAGLTELPPITGAAADVAPMLGTGGAHAPGLIAYGTYDLTQPSYAIPELMLPADYVLGDADALPEWLRRDAVKAAWTTRVEQVYPSIGYAPSTSASDWPRITDAIAALPAYDFATSLFAPATTARVFDAAAPTNAVAAANARARASEGEGYQRAYEMSSATRSMLYDAAMVAQDAAVIATMEREARNRSVEDGVTHVAVAQSALGFDFATGEWLYATVPVEPGPGGVSIHAPPPAGSQPGANGPGPANGAPGSSPGSAPTRNDD